MTEAKYEIAICQLLEELGWRYVPEALHPVRDFRNPLFEEKLRTAIEALPVNRGVPSAAMDAAIKKIESVEGAGLIDRNRLFTDYLQNGIPVSFLERREERTVRVQLVDFDHPAANDFSVVNQWTVEGKCVRRPDVILFVNGLPLVVLELKSPSREETDEDDAYLQLRNYLQDIPELFVYNAILVTSDMTVTRAGTITSDRERFMQWKSVDGKYENTKTAQFETLFRGLLAPARLLDVVRNFICFSHEDTGWVKILAGYHQYFAVKKAIVKTQKACGFDGRAGVFWHTQGSGKSLSMVFYAKLLARVMKSPTFVVLTDRNDLDGQLFAQFAHCQDFLQQTPIEAKNRKNLQELLKGRTANGIFFSTIQKFEESNEPLSERSDIIVIADEAHRSHYGLVDRMKTTRNEQGDLIVRRQIGCARIIRDSLPKATYIAFTGTPIDAKNRSTREVFGDYIDVYDMSQSVADGATKPLYYESRVAQLKLDQNVLKAVDAEYENLSREEVADDVTIEQSKHALSQLEQLLGHPKTIEMLAKDIVTHYEEHRASILTGKAMIVAYSREIAVKLYYAILKLRPEWAVKMKIVMTESNQDPEEWRALTGDKRYRRELDVQFKDNRSAFKIAIVVDMWLTGFNVPSMATMYVYKPMVGHNLMQAITRLNRPYKDKEGGLIVDYIGIAAFLKDAMKVYAHYSGGKKGESAGGEIRETAYARFLENLEICRDCFHGYDYMSRLEASPLEQGRNVTEALNWILPPEKKEARDAFLEHALKMHQAAQLCGSVITADERTEAAFFEAVRVQVVRVLMGGNKGKISLRELNERVQKLIESSVQADGILNVYTDVGEKESIFSAEFLSEIAKMKERNLAVEMLKSLIKEQLHKYRRRDLVKAEKFSELMQSSLNKYLNGHINNEKVIQELLALAREFKADQDAERKMGFDAEEAAFYSALTRPRAVKDFYTNDTLKEMTKELAALLRKNRTIDWQRHEASRANMRLLVKRLLKHYKYPPDEAQEAMDCVLSQCELWADTASWESPEPPATEPWGRIIGGRSAPTDEPPEENEYEGRLAAFEDAEENA